MACHCVTASGSGSQTGADWSHALAGSALSGTSLVRGDTYYLADGNYANVSFQQPVSGTSVITVKKAISTDHCTDTGWNTGTMGSSTATFHFNGGNACVTFTTSYWVLDGNGTGNATPSSFYGILVDYTAGTDCNGTQCWYVRNFPLFTANISNITVRYVKENGHGNQTNTHYDEGFYFFADQNLTFQNNYIYNCSGTPFEFGNNTTVLVDHNFVDTTYYTASNHSGGIQDQNTSNLTVTNNVWKDMEGTSVITELFRSGSPGTANNWFIAGNVWYQSQAPINSPFNGDGFAACINTGTICTNWKIYNNAIVNITNNSAGIVCSPCSSGNSFDIQNNIWYLNTASMSIPGGAGVTVTENYNSFIGNTFSNGYTSTGANDQTSSSTTSPFVSWPTANFNLANENSLWTSPNSSLFTGSNATDPNNTTRTTDRGAYQFTGQVSTLGGSKIVGPVVLFKSVFS